MRDAIFGNHVGPSGINTVHQIISKKHLKK